MAFDNLIRVYDKNMNKIAEFRGDNTGTSEEAKRNLMVNPTVHIESNGNSTFTFQMLADSSKWNEIKNPENIYVLNGRYYTALAENAYQYTDNNGVSIVDVSLVETWYLLDRQFNQAYNCSIYCYAKATFAGYNDTGAIFKIKKQDCSNLGNMISNDSAWEQVKTWIPKENGINLSYAILTSDEYKPTNWQDAPSAVFMNTKTISGNEMTIVVEARAKTGVKQTYDYVKDGTYSIKEDIVVKPTSLKSVKVNYTYVDQRIYLDNNKSTPNPNYGKTTTEDMELENNPSGTTANYTYTYNKSTGSFIIRFPEVTNQFINAVIAEYEYGDLGEISTGATCTFAYGAEVVDEHTFVILPKADAKYKLTIDGVIYADTQVVDIRGVQMPRGSGGYAMWAALKGSNWSLGVCDVIAKGFDASIDYGAFNVESDMKSVLENIQEIQKLYGGILDWNSKDKILNYRAENSDDYNSFNDGFNEWTGYEFRQGKNLIATPQITYDNKIITKAYVLGYGDLNIKDVNNGKTYIENHSYTEDIYEGYIKQELIYDTNDNGGKLQLKYWAEKELAKLCRPRKTIELSVTDIRTTEGYEHEVFDINNVVKVYFTNPYTGESEVEEQRIVMWEYNAFAMWDCSVELGDKTRNLTEVFKLIYNMTQDAPGVDGSGNISSGNVTITPGRENIDERNPSLSDYLELIAHTTTNNADALSKLSFTTNNMYSQVELFAKYQKQTDNLISNAYAGLSFYASEKSTEARLAASNYTDDQLEERIFKADSELKTWATTNESGFVLSAVTQSKNYVNNTFGPNLTHNIKVGIVGLAADDTGTLKSYVDSTTYKNGIVNSAKTEITQNVLPNYATTSMLSSYYTKSETGVAIANAISGFSTTVSQTYATTQQFSTLNNRVASIETAANNLDATITAKVTSSVDSKYGSYIVITQSDIKFTTTNAESYMIMNNQGRISILCSNKLILSSDKEVSIMGTITITSTTSANNITFVSGDVTFNGKIQKASFNWSPSAFRLVASDGTYYINTNATSGSALYAHKV